MNVLKLPTKTFAEAQRIRMRFLAAGELKTITLGARDWTERQSASEAHMFLGNLYKYRNEIAPFSDIRWDLESDIITATTTHRRWQSLADRYEERPWEKGDVVKYGHGVVKQFILEPMEDDDV